MADSRFETDSDSGMDVPQVKKKMIIDSRVKDIPTGPSVTVFVGNITERAPDTMVGHLLTTCGIVSSWNWVQGAPGKLQAFGFCEFSNPDAGLRAVRILNGYEIADKELVVKVDAKTKRILLDYLKERIKKNSAEEPEEDEEILKFVDDDMKNDDKQANDRITQILSDHKAEIESYVSRDTMAQFPIQPQNNIERESRSVREPKERERRSDSNRSSRRRTPTPPRMKKKNIPQIPRRSNNDKRQIKLNTPFTPKQEEKKKRKKRTKKFQCEFCFKSFKFKRSKTRHIIKMVCRKIKNQQPTKETLCEHCGKSFSPQGLFYHKNKPSCRVLKAINEN